MRNVSMFISPSYHKLRLFQGVPHVLCMLLFMWADWMGMLVYALREVYYAGLRGALIASILQPIQEVRS